MSEASSTSSSGGGQPPAPSRQTIPPPQSWETIPPASTPSVETSQRETILPGQSDSVAEVTRVSGVPPSPQFGRYRIEECLGQGAMGAVYKAHDSQLDRLVAIKIPKFDAADTALLERFYREARAAATLSHASICPVFDVGEIDGTHYISMGYIEGKPLSAFIRPEKPLSEKQAVMIVRKLAVALDEAHGKGIVHRDLKPDNVMIGPRSNPIIMDFGLARRSTGTDDIRVTQGGQMLGTPAYMSPEQVEGDVNLMGPRSDIYSLGVMLYEMLTGRLPYEGSIASVLAQIIKGQPAPPTQLRDGLNPELQAICLKMMASELGDRYASMGDVARDLMAFIKGQPTSVHDSIAAAPPTGLPAGDAGLSQLIVAEDVPISTRTSRKSRVKSSTAQSSPSSRRGLPSWAVWSGAAAAGIAILLAGYTLFVKVGDETVRIQIDDPAAQVFVDGDEVRIENLGATVELKPGKHGMEIRRGDIVVKADTFTVLKGDNPVLKLEVVDATSDKSVAADSTGPATATESTSGKPAAESTLRVTPTDVSWLKLSDEMPDAYRNSSKPEVRVLGWLIDRGVGATVRLSPQQTKPIADFRETPPDVPFTIDALRGGYSEIKKSDWAFLGLLPNLKSAHWNSVDFDDDDLSYLGGHANLTNISLMSTSVTDDGLRHLATMPELASVTIVLKRGRQEITDAAMTHLGRITKLASLQLKSCDITDDGLAQLAAERPPLIALALFYCGEGITHAGLARLSVLPSLTILKLIETDLNDDDVWLIAKKAQH
jgi:serine/threonine protein kinase